MAEVAREEGLGEIDSRRSISCLMSAACCDRSRWLVLCGLAAAEEFERVGTLQAVG